MTADPLPAALGSDHLTAALRRCGALAAGRVTAVAVASSRATTLSQIIQVRLSYDGAAQDAPRALVFKSGHPARADGSWGGGRAEVAFYTDVASAIPGYPVPRCFEANADETTKAWHVLLEDLSESHFTLTDWPLPPDMRSCEIIMAARARLQAASWGDPRLGTAIGTWPWRTDEHLAHFAAHVAKFADRHGDRLPRERLALYERLIGAAPRLFARDRNLTIVQGDAHFWNCFLPRDGGGDVRFFDWDSWRVDLGTCDLAYMIAMHWYPDRRRRVERALLDSYHAALVAHGVRNYDRAALDEDYRLAVLWQITTPVWQESYGIPPFFWWNNLERIMLAVDDLGCRDLLG
jgi:hypothetical protein